MLLRSFIESQQESMHYTNWTTVFKRISHRDLLILSTPRNKNIKQDQSLCYMVFRWPSKPWLLWYKITNHLARKPRALGSTHGKMIVERITTDIFPSAFQRPSGYNQRWETRMCRGWHTHLHHLLYVFFDDCWVSVGLHRHSPVIDHGGLGFRRRGGAGVLLQPVRNQRGLDQYQPQEADAVIFQGQEKTAAVQSSSQGLQQQIKMSWERKNKDLCIVFVMWSII